MALTLDIEPLRRKRPLLNDYGTFYDGSEYITLNYLRWYPESARTKSFHGVHVRVHSNGYYWRHNAQGYTTNIDEAWVTTFETALYHTDHIGPEKNISYLKVNKA